MRIALALEQADPGDDAAAGGSKDISRLPGLRKKGVAWTRFEPILYAEDSGPGRTLDPQPPRRTATLFTP